MGVDKGILNAMQEHKEKVGQPHFIFSAENPAHPAKNELGLSHEQALGHLKGAGYDAHAVEDHYGAPERSIIVYGVQPNKAEDLHGMASRLGQDSSIYSTGKNHEMRFHHGAQAGKKVLGEGTVWHNEKPQDFYTTLPGEQHHFTHNFNFGESDAKPLAESENVKDFWNKENLKEKKLPKPQTTPEPERGPTEAKEHTKQRSHLYGVKPKLGKINKSEDKKVPEDYKEKARNNCDFLFKVKIKNKSKLSDEIPLHMSVKIFDSLDQIDMDKIKEAIKELNLKSPDPKKIKFKPIIFHSDKSGNDYYMLKILDCDDSYEKFYNKFKNVGTVYEKFIPHVTINKEIYNDVKENGLKPEDIEFSPFTLENGANNTIKVFEDTLDKSEDLNKGTIKNMATALGMAGALAGTSPKPQKVAAMQQPRYASQIPKKPQYSHQKMLQAIADVESAGGKLEHHKPTSHGTAYGKYGLMPDTIRDTIKMNPDLRRKYGKAMRLQGAQLSNFMQDNPGLEDTIADKHLQRLEHHFQQNPNKLGYAWNQGITGAYNAKPNQIMNHPYTKKISSYYGKIK